MAEEERRSYGDLSDKITVLQVQHDNLSLKFDTFATDNKKARETIVKDVGLIRDTLLEQSAAKRALNKAATVLLSGLTVLGAGLAWLWDHWGK